MGDILFEAKNNFFLGNYQGTINEVNRKSKQLRDNSKTEGDYFLYRSYIAQENYQLVLSEIAESNNDQVLQTVRLFAAYLSSPSNKERVLTTINQWYNTNGFSGMSPLALFIIASIQYQEQNYEDTLRTLYKTDNLECMSLLVQTYLKIDRLDLAEKQYSQMKQIDVDATPTLLANAWILITQGDEKTKEALQIYEELSEKYGPTSLLLNGRSVCEMMFKRFEKAESLLLQSIEKNSKDNATIANLVVCYMHMKKPTDIINRYLNQLKSNSPNYQWIESMNNSESSFDRCKTRFG